MGHISNEAHRGVWGPGVWAIWALAAQGVLGIRGMGHMGNGTHGPWGTWAMGPMGDWTFLPITSLILDGFLQKFYWT